jgi:hypothetical protein
MVEFGWWGKLKLGLSKDRERISVNSNLRSSACKPSPSIANYAEFHSSIVSTSSPSWVARNQLLYPSHRLTDVPLTTKHGKPGWLRTRPNHRHITRRPRNLPPMYQYGYLLKDKSPRSLEPSIIPMGLQHIRPRPCQPTLKPRPRHPIQAIGSIPPRPNSSRLSCVNRNPLVRKTCLL